MHNLITNLCLFIYGLKTFKIMRKLFFALSFALVGTFALANNNVNNFNYYDNFNEKYHLLTLDETIINNLFEIGTCTVTVSGYDEWGCYYKESLTFTSPEMTAEACDALGAIVGILHLMGTLMTGDQN